MILSSKIEEIKKVMDRINQLSYAEDRVKNAISFKNELRAEFNDLLDELFSHLDLKKRKNE